MVETCPWYFAISSQDSCELQCPASTVLVWRGCSQRSEFDGGRSALCGAPSNLPDAAIIGIYGNPFFLFLAPLCVKGKAVGGQEEMVVFRESERTKWHFDCMFLEGRNNVRAKWKTGGGVMKNK